MAAQTSGRKQWRLFRGPKGNIQSVGWDEFGCPETQVKLAKQLLEDNEGDKEEKARLGVYWLVKASERGHEEATAILHNCLLTGLGITEHNLPDVRLCLEMSQGEKLSREAANQLFSSLSQGENYITVNQLLKEVSRSSQDSPDSESEQSSGWWEAEEAPGGGDRLTEEMVVGAASHLYRGELPVALRASYRDWTTASLALLSPPPHHLHLDLHTLTLLILATVSILGLEALLEALPHLIYYLTLSVMMVTTCRVLIKKWEFDQFKQWSNLLVAWGVPDSNAYDAQWSHCFQNALPSFLFLLTLTISILVSPFVPSIPHSELSVFSTLMSLFVLYNLMWYKSKLDVPVITLFVVHLLARYPYEIDTVVSQYWRYLDVHVPTFTSYVIGNGVEFCLNFRVLFYLMMPGLMLRIASRDRWLGLFTLLLPITISLSWWHMAVIASKGATQFGLIRSCLGIIGCFIFLPMSGLAALLLVFVTAAKLVLLQQIPASTAYAASAVVTLVFLALKWTRSFRFSFWLQLGLAVPCLWLLVSSTTESLQEGGGSLSEAGLSWEEYRSVCQSGGEERCSQLGGLQVTWEGRLLSHRLLNIYNPMELIVTKLPLGLRESSKCLFGEPYNPCNESIDCSHPLKNKCHLSSWNRYEYELEVLLSSEETGGWSSGGAVHPQTGLLISSPTLANFTRHLHSGDRLWFSGLLAAPPPSTLLTTTPRLSLLQIGCLSCAHMSPTTVAPQSGTFSLGLPLRAIFHFIFSPLVNMK